MSKVIMDFKLDSIEALTASCSLLKLSPANGDSVPAALPGQFVQVRVDESKTTFLRRPISICNVDRTNNQIWLLVRRAGDGTAALVRSVPGQIINLILPLGNTFTLDHESTAEVLLVGGGVGMAPMYMLANHLASLGVKPHVLVGARSASELMLLDELNAIANLHISTDDGSAGMPGVVTQNDVMNRHWDFVCCCGPAPMMKAVAKKARENGSPCEVSLENMMACGLGACLCCVEKTVKGNVCVCTDGPVFDTDCLTWS